MNRHDDDQIERRLREIEAELSIQHIPRSAKPQPQPKGFQLGSLQVKKAAKIAAFAATGFVGVWVFSAVVSYVSIAIGFVIAAGVSYVGYKLFFERKNMR
ncbi:MAG TPA: hypothetical protein V6D28_29520 [Leptolyngbyaceae cyanobacterium]